MWFPTLETVDTLLALTFRKLCSGMHRHWSRSMIAKHSCWTDRQADGRIIEIDCIVNAVDIHAVLLETRRFRKGAVLATVPVQLNAAPSPVWPTPFIQTTTVPRPLS